MSKKRFFHSIRWQVQLWYGLLLLAGTVIFGGIYHQLVWLEKGKEIDLRLEEKRFMIINGLRNAMLKQRGLLALVRGFDPEKPFATLLQSINAGDFELPEEIQTTFSGNEAGFYFYRLEDENGNIVLESENSLGDFDFPNDPPEGVTVKARYNGKFRELASSDASGFRLAVGQEISVEIREMRRVMARAVVFGTGLWVAGLIGGWIIAGRTIKPISAISSAAVRISEGDFGERIEVKNKSGNELHELASVLNHTFDRLENFLERQCQFTADASHELRTPLTVILAETQRMKKKKRTVEEYEEMVDLCIGAGTRMKKLVEDLLLLARQDTNDSNLHIESFEIQDLLSDVLKSHRVIASQKGIGLFDEIEPVSVASDMMKLTVLLNNIIGNAISHHQGDGSVWVHCSREASMVVISVKDDGPGIDEAHLPHIFDRFYRVEKARTTAGAHSGLGLAVVDLIINQLEGKVEVKSSVGVGTEFILKFPAEAVS
jgi:two-component system OmpR family sensor kinase